MRRFFQSLASATLILLLAGNAGAQSQGSLPVYEVARAGIASSETKKLANAFHLVPGMLAVRNGAVSFVDPSRYLIVPTVSVGDAQLILELSAPSWNQRLTTRLSLNAIDIQAIEKLPVLNAENALGNTVNAFNAAKLSMQNAKPIIGHTRFLVFFVNGRGDAEPVRHDLDTSVSYEFFDKNEHPLIGPGAVAKVTYDGFGRVIQLLYARRELKEGPSVEVFSKEEARKRVVKRFPPNAEISIQLVYWCPPLQVAPGQKSPLAPRFIIPWYALSGVSHLPGRKTTADSELRSKVELIPATDDPRFVPAVNLEASGLRRVTATVHVTGGRPPYTYVWSGSNPDLSSQRGASVGYIPLARITPVPEKASSVAATLSSRETVSVIVTDANGVVVQQNRTISVMARLVSAKKAASPSASYGTESPREPDFAIDRVGWEEGMETPSAGGGSQTFAWLGNMAWPGDFIEPIPPATLVKTPWVNGDADFSDWGVNTAAIVLNNTDGWAAGFDSSQPGAVNSDYPTAELSRPLAQNGTVTIDLLNSRATVNTRTFKVKYDGSWSPLGPNDSLLWLAMDACDVLDATDATGNPSQRWGAAFGGLHIITGWDSQEAVGDGSFEKDFAQSMLGVNGQALNIVQAWFFAASLAGFDHGVPAAMGPITTGNVSDVDDFYLGKGSQGPTIIPRDVTGWWYVHE